jgi:hypothetical protein
VAANPVFYARTKHNEVDFPLFEIELFKICYI